MMNHSHNKKFCSLLTGVLIVFLTSCVTNAFSREEFYTDPQILPMEELCPDSVEWQTVSIPDLPENTVQIASFKNIERKTLWKCVKIDLNVPNLTIEAEPQILPPEKCFYIKEFAKKNNVFVAINTLPFDLDNKFFTPVGIVKIRGKTISPAVEYYSAFGFTETDGILRGKVIKNQTEEALKNCFCAFGGFFTILENGEILEYAKNKRSRAAAGISENGRFLYLFAGGSINLPSDRNGYNFQECARILQKLGCTDAIEFDGGHSTCLNLNKKDIIKPSLQRKVPAAFGLKVSE